MKSDILYLVAFILLVVLFLWVGGPLLRPPAPYISPSLPISEGVAVVVYGAFPPVSASLTIGSSACLHALLKETYPQHTPTTDVLYFVIHGGEVRGVVPYRVDSSVLKKLSVMTKDMYMMYVPTKEKFDVMGVDLARRLTEKLHMCISMLSASTSTVMP